MSCFSFKAVKIIDEHIAYPSSSLFLRLDNIILLQVYQECNPNQSNKLLLKIMLTFMYAFFIQVGIVMTWK